MKKTLKSIQEQFGITPNNKLNEQDNREFQEQLQQFYHYMEVLKKKKLSLWRAYGHGEAAGRNVPSNLDNVITHLKQAIEEMNK